MIDKHILLIEPCNFENYPQGGQLAMVLHLVKAFGNRFALVGLSTDETPVGRWIRHELEGQEFLYFAAGTRRPSGARPWVPARLRWYWEVGRWRRAILSLGATTALVQSPETLLAIYRWGWTNLCYQSPGVANPMFAARYPGARLLAGLYDRRLFRALAGVDVVLAAADCDSIAAMLKRGRNRLQPEKIAFCPTCVDTCQFRPQPIGLARRSLVLEGSTPLIVASGRISRSKGWPLLIEAFRLFLATHPGARLVFVGDGEDRRQLESQVRRVQLSDQVRVTGSQPPERVCAFLNAADLVVVGSVGEGWSVAMLEALACGKTLVSTDVSGARAMIRPGENGFIVPGRNPARFAQAMHDALGLPGASEVSLALARTYSLESFRNRIASLWQPLSA